MQLEKNKDIIEYRNNSDKDKIEYRICVRTNTDKAVQSGIWDGQQLVKTGQSFDFYYALKEKEKEKEKRKNGRVRAEWKSERE